MEKKKNRGISFVKYFILIVIVINVLANILPALIGAWNGFRSGQSDENVSDVRIVDVSSQVVTDYEGYTPMEGYRMYRFDVTVNNMGSRDEDMAYAVYLRSGDGVAFQQTDSAYTDASRNVTDSRIVPRGRSSVITLYGEVSEESTTVEFYTYYTPDSEDAVYVYELPETTV